MPLLAWRYSYQAQEDESWYPDVYVRQLQQAPWMLIFPGVVLSIKIGWEASLHAFMQIKLKGGAYLSLHCLLCMSSNLGTQPVGASATSMAKPVTNSTAFQLAVRACHAPATGPELAKLHIQSASHHPIRRCVW